MQPTLDAAQRGEALAGVDCELAVLRGELLVHDGQSAKLGSPEDHPDAVCDHQADDGQQNIIADAGSFAHFTR
jgi:hypothetical protein